MHRSRALGAAAAVSGVLALGGCLDGVAVDEPVYQQLYVDAEFEYAARSGELRTNVYGTPVAGARDGVVALTTAAMRGANRGPEVTFTPTPAGEGSGAYHVVMLFNPVGWVAPYDVCKDPVRYAGAPSDSRVRLVSAFCFGETMVSNASGSVTGVKGLGDPRFKSLVRQVTLSLFPAYDHWDIGGDGDNIPG